MKTRHACPIVGRLALAGLLFGLSLAGAAAQDKDSDSAAPATPAAPAIPVKSGVEKFLEQDYLLGDWDGLRTELSRHGVDFEFLYAGSVPNNLAGGVQRGAVYQGALMMMMDLDSEKLVNYPGGTFHVSSLWLNGHENFSTYPDGQPAYVGDLNKVNLLDFPNAFRLWELWYQQKFLDDRISIKAGELSVDRDFVVPELYTSLGMISFINQTFFYPTLLFDVYDIPGLPARGHGLPSTPNAAPGAILRVQPLPQWYVQAGAYNGKPDDSYSGTKFSLNTDSGALLYFETGYHYNAATNQPGPEGSIKVGAFYHTGSFWDVKQAITAAFYAQAGVPGVNAELHSGDYGLYLLAEHQLFLEKDKQDPAKQGLIGFFRLEGAPPDRNLTELGVDGGFVYKGLIPGRDWDTVGIAASYLKMSRDIASAQQNVNALALGAGSPVVPFAAIADYETVLEFNYRAQVTAWWTLQASLQRVFHPGGSAAIPDATVFILQTTVRF